MSFQIHEREVEGITILDLHGRLVAGAETETFRDCLEQLLERQRNNVILDLNDVSFIDSTGLGALVAGHSSFKGAGGAMKLLHLSQRNVQLLILTKLSTVFQSFDEERAAINSFFPDRERKRFDILEFVRNQGSEPTDLEAIPSHEVEPKQPE